MSQKYIKYGDQIFLYSNEDPKTYLLARSTFEESVYFLQVPDHPLLDISSYSNQSELIFTIYPRLFYEASKNYFKYSINDARKSTLKSRMDAEKEINQKRIERYLGENVTIGSEIQLYHFYSKSFVKATRERSSLSNQLFNLGLSRVLSSGMHFKIRINPYFNFKKEGEKITYEDQFYFETIKMGSCLVYKELPELIYDEKKNTGVAGPSKLKRQAMAQNYDEIQIEYPISLETQSIFKNFQAGHRKDEINIFKAQFIKRIDNKEMNQIIGFKNINWGDYVRIKHIRRIDKKSGVLLSDHIVTGHCPEVHIITQDHDFPSEKESVSSIFQIFHPQEDLFGMPIEIPGENQSFSIWLRHLITGRLLVIGENKNYNSCKLSENLENFIEKHPTIRKTFEKKPIFRPRKITTNSNSGSITGSVREISSPIRSKYSPTLRKAKDSIIHLQQQEQSLPLEDTNNKILPVVDLGLAELQEYYNESEILLMVASKDADTLNSSNCFSLQGRISNKYLGVCNEESVMEGRYTEMLQNDNPEKNFISQECFQRYFFNMNPLERKSFGFQNGDEMGDFFFFSLVTDEEITDLMSISSINFPLMNLTSKNLFEKIDLINQVDNAISKFCFWVCDAKEKIKKKPLATRQKLLREYGVIDCIMKILFELFSRKMLVENQSIIEILNLADNIIRLLHLLAEGIYSNPNSIYIFQWYSLFKMIITEESSANELKIDNLLIELFKKTKLNVSYQNDLERLIPSIQFEYYNKNALNLVIAFCSYNEFLQKEDVESIILSVLDTEKANLLFRPFDLLKDKVVIEINIGEPKLELNEKNITNNIKIFEYLANLLLLSIELSKGNPALVIQSFERIYPFDVCLSVLRSKEINSKFKALFITFFKESYLAYDCRYTPIQTFPNFIKFKKQGLSHWQGDKKFAQYNLTIVIKYFNENIADEISNLNLKKIINQFLRNNELWIRESHSTLTQDDHLLIKSILELCDFILERGFYGSSSELDELRRNLWQFLKNGYANLMIVLDQKSSHKKSQTGMDMEYQKSLIEGDFQTEKSITENLDINWTAQWMIKIIDCLIFLEKKTQDSYLMEYYSSTENKTNLKKSEKDKKIKEYLYSLQYPDTVDIFYLIELLLLNNIDLSQKVVELLSLIFSMRKNFLTNLNQCILIDESNLEIYQSLSNVLYKLHYSIIDIHYSKSNETDFNSQLLCDLDFTMKKLLTTIFKTPEEIKQVNSNSSFIFIDPEHAFIPCECIQQQNIAREISLHIKILQIIDIINKSSSYKDKTFENKAILLKKCVIFLIFFNKDNEENQSRIRDHHNFEDLLYEILTRDDRDLQRLVFVLISEIYRNNYYVLLNFDKQNNELPIKLAKKFNSNFGVRNNKEYCVYFLQLLTFFFKINEKTLAQNQNFLIKEISRMVRDFPDPIELCYQKILNLKIIENSNNLVIIPEEITVLTIFLNVFTMISDKASNLVINYVKQFFSISQITNLLKRIDDWLMLKLELLSFCNQIFIKNKKLEENEIKDLQYLVKDVVIGFLNDYIDDQEKYNFHFISKIINIFEKKTLYSSKTDIIDFNRNELIEKFIIFGVIETLNSYLDKIPEKPDDIDMIIIDNMLINMEKLVGVWGLAQTSAKNMLASTSRRQPNLSSSNIEGIEAHKTVQIRKTELKYFFNLVFDSKKAGDRARSLIVNDKALEKIEKNDALDEKIIEEEHSLEMEYMTGFLIEIKIHESKDMLKLKKIIENLINVVGNNQSPISTKLKAIKIIRKLSNFKKDMKVNEEIQKELVDINLMDFLCKVAAAESNPLITMEYILGLVDFMDEANENIQKSFYKYLSNDQENQFLLKIREYLLENFNDFRDYDRSLRDQSIESIHFSLQLKKILNQKSSSCIIVLELLRLSCENHYLEMQNFLREQVISNKPSLKSINMIVYISELLEKYSKMISEHSLPLGEKIIDFLIESLQGPCNANQQILCNSKLMENLEDMLDMQLIRKNQGFSSFTNKIIVLMLALFEGNSDPFVLNKIASYVTPELMYMRIIQIHQRFYHISKKTAFLDYNEKIERGNQDLEPQESFDENKKLTPLSIKNIENSVSEAFNIYILMKMLRNMHAKLNEKVRIWKETGLIRLSVKEQDRSKKALKYYKSNVVMIEIINNQNNIQRVFFRLPLQTKFLSKATIKNFIDTVNRESIDEKINGLIKNQPKFLEEMQHFMRLRGKGLRFSIEILSILRDASLIVSAVISFIILLNSGSETKNVLNFFTVVQLVLTIMIFVLWAIFQLPLDYQHVVRIYNEELELLILRKKEKNVIFTDFQKRRVSSTIQQSIYFYYVLIKEMLFNSYLLFFTLNILWSTLGITVSKIFNTLLLLDIVHRSVILQNVIKSITINWPQLFMTGILGLIIMYIYSMIGYYSSPEFRENMIFQEQVGTNNDENLYLCNTPLHCFMFVVNIGLRMGGGVGEAAKQPLSDNEFYNDRFFYDLSFFLFINIIWLNIIFGIIIDTFAELRDQKTRKDFDEKNNCFICNKERSVFEKVGVSFVKHVKKEHNPWNYLFFVIHLQLKDPNEYNGTESYISGKLLKKDISWFPIERSLSLELKETEKT